MTAELLRNRNPSIAVQVETLAQGGASLRNHLEASALEPTIREGHFDTVVFQDRGGFPLCDPSIPACADSTASIKAFVSLIKSVGARPVWYSTWQGTPGAQRSLSRMVAKMASGFGVEVADVGAAFFLADASHLGAAPFRDDGHPTPTGSWVAAAVLADHISPPIRIPTEGISVCAPDWTGHDPKISEPLSAQNQPPNRCFDVSATTLREIAGVVARLPRSRTPNNRWRGP
jgi:hypothetical protein